MATRFYLPSGNAPDISPAVHSSWSTAAILRAAMSPTKKNSGYSSGGVSTSGGANTDHARLQYISDKLAAQTINGTFGGFAKAIESSGTIDARSQVVVRVVSADGTVVRGVLVAPDTSGLSNEWLTGAGVAQAFPKGGPVAVTPVTCVDGDRIVVELGLRKHAAANTTFAVYQGDVTANPDIAVEGEVASAANGWMEFSQTLVFYNQHKARVYHEAANVLWKKEGKARVYDEAANVLWKKESKARVYGFAANVVVGTWAGPSPYPAKQLKWGIPLTFVPPTPPSDVDVSISDSKYFSSGSGVADSNTLTIPKPAGLVVGQVMVVFIHHVYIPDLPGWMPLVTSSNSGVNVASTASSFWRYATAGDVAAWSHVATMSGTYSGNGVILSFNDCDSVEASSANGGNNGTTLFESAFASLSSGTRILHMAGTRNSMTPPNIDRGTDVITGFVDGVSSGGDFGLRVTTELQAAIGSGAVAGMTGGGNGKEIHAIVLTRA